MNNYYKIYCHHVLSTILCKQILYQWPGVNTDQFLHVHFTFSVLKENPGLEENSYELCYNMACYLIGREDYKGAEQKLKKAEGTSPCV